MNLINRMDMELENLKLEWRDLDARLNEVEAQARRLAAGTAAGQLGTSRRRLKRVALVPMALLCGASFGMYGICKGFAPQYGIPAMIFMSLFVVAVVVSHAIFLRLLQEIDPVRQTVSEACAGVIRLRRHFLWSMAVKIPLAVPTLVCLALGSIDRDPDAWRFLWLGLVVGALAGTRIFLRASDEIARLRHSIRELE